MAIKLKSNGKYLVDVRDEQGVRIQRTFKNKSDAKAFEGDIYRNKYESLLVKNKLRESRYPIGKALDDYLHGKQTVGNVSDDGTVKVQGLKSGIRLFYSDKLGLVIEGKAGKED